MIDSAHDYHTPVCDACGTELEAYDDFHDAVNGKKAAGWRSKNENGEWLDYCADCWEASIWEDC